MSILIIGIQRVYFSESRHQLIKQGKHCRAHSSNIQSMYSQRILVHLLIIILLSSLLNFLDPLKFKEASFPYAFLEVVAIEVVPAESVLEIHFVLSLVPMSGVRPEILPVSVHLPLHEIPLVERSVSVGHFALALDFVAILFGFQLSRVFYAVFKLHCDQEGFHLCGVDEAARLLIPVGYVEEGYLVFFAVGEQGHRVVAFGEA